MGHGYSIACTLFETGGESFGNGYKFRDSFLSGASTRDIVSGWGVVVNVPKNQPTIVT